MQAFIPKTERGKADMPKLKGSGEFICYSAKKEQLKHVYTIL